MSRENIAEKINEIQHYAEKARNCVFGDNLPSLEGLMRAIAMTAREAVEELVKERSHAN